MNQKKISPHHNLICDILQNVKGKPLSLEERQKLSIDLSSLFLKEAIHNLTASEKKGFSILSKMIDNPSNKALIIQIIDICFLSRSPSRIVDKMLYLLAKYQIPSSLSFLHQTMFFLFQYFGSFFPKFFYSYFQKTLRSEFSSIIIQEETLANYTAQKSSRNYNIHFYRPNTSAIGNQDAQVKLHHYLADLANPKIHAIYVKSSSLVYHLSSDNWDFHFQQLCLQLRILFKAACDNPIKKENTSHPKSITLCAELYSNFSLILAAFKQVLNEEDFHAYSPRIVLQAYFPDAFELQQQLTEWAMERLKKGHSPIGICLVKGSYLSKEHSIASKKNWPSACFLSKSQTDANFKKMLLYGALNEHIRAANITVCTHNLFDISFALLLQQEQEVSSYMTFEMFEGFLPHVQKTLKDALHSLNICCAISSKEEFARSMNYLTRRMDELTLPDHFLSQFFKLKPDSPLFDELAGQFIESCKEISSISSLPRKTQNRNLPPKEKDFFSPFDNDPIIDLSIKNNQKFAKELIEKWKKPQPVSLPLVIGENTIQDNEDGKGYDPSNPHQPLYTYCQASKEQILQTIEIAKDTEESWRHIPVEKKRELILNIAQEFRKNRHQLIGSTMADIGKTLLEADAEVCSAIDNIEYYCLRITKLLSKTDLEWKPKGTCLVISSRSFPCSAPTTGIIAALITGNCVIFKPAPDSVLPAWFLIKAMWQAGIPKNVLQFINCKDELTDKYLLPDPRVSFVISTSKFQTAQKFLSVNPYLDLTGIANGINTMYISAMADRKQAIKNLVSSAFNFSGQKYGATSIAIVEDEVYRDLHFRKQLKDAAESLPVGSQWDLKTFINPLIQKPDETLLKQLTTLENNEKWLLKPKQDPQNPNIWSPGIKYDVSAHSDCFKTPYLGPVLSLIKAKNIHHAIELIHSIPFGLSAGLQSLDEREHHIWLSHVEVGNYYINRQMNDFIIRREPFGGCKKSSFGQGFKEGGPNFLKTCMIPSQVNIPKQKRSQNEKVNKLTPFLEKIDLTAEQLGLWYASISNYAFWWKRMKQQRDPSKIIGQDNYFGYIPLSQITLRITSSSAPLDILRVCAAALTCESPMEISYDSSQTDGSNLFFLLKTVDEKEEDLLKRIRKGEIQRLRMVAKAPRYYYESAAESGCYIADQPVLANGRCELLHYIREITISYDYHRNGCLGIREGELRKPLF